MLCLRLLAGPDTEGELSFPSPDGRLIAVKGVEGGLEIRDQTGKILFSGFNETFHFESETESEILRRFQLAGEPLWSLDSKSLAIAAKDLENSNHWQSQTYFVCPARRGGFEMVATPQVVPDDSANTLRIEPRNWLPGHRLVVSITAGYSRKANGAGFHGTAIVSLDLAHRSASIFRKAAVVETGEMPGWDNGEVPPTPPDFPRDKFIINAGTGEGMSDFGTSPLANSGRQSRGLFSQTDPLLDLPETPSNMVEEMNPRLLEIDFDLGLGVAPIVKSADDKGVAFDVSFRPDSHEISTFVLSDQAQFITYEHLSRKAQEEISATKKGRHLFLLPPGYGYWSIGEFSRKKISLFSPLYAERGGEAKRLLECTFSLKRDGTAELESWDLLKL